MPELFESIFMSISLTMEEYLTCIAAALGCGLIVGIASAIRSHISKSFMIALTLLPMIVATVIIMVNGEVGTGVAVMGAFSLIRFRSVPGKAKDITSIFLSMTAGLTCAAGYPLVALLFTAVVALLLMALSFIPMGVERYMDLHITVPESLHFGGAFDDLFRTYTRSCRLVRARTTNMGSMYKLQYRVLLKKRSQMQAFIDDLRCRNGNLEISLSEPLNGGDDL